MKIKVNVNEFKNTVKDMELILKEKQTIPALNCLHIKAENETITATVNNLEITIVKTIQGNVIESGETLIHIDDLQLIYKLKDDAELYFHDNKCTVTANRMFEFITEYASDEFPQTPDIQGENANYSIAESELLYSLKLEKLTAKDAEYKPALCGIWIDGNYILAVDGFRIGRIETGNNAEYPFIINNKVIDILQKILDKKSNTEVKFYLSDTKKYIKIQSERFSVIYRPYAGECINHKQHFDNLGTAITIDSNTFSDSINFIVEVIKHSNKGTKTKDRVEYLINSKEICLNAITKSKNVKETIQVQKCDSDNFELCIAFDPIFVKDVLSLLNGKNINMTYIKEMSPSIITGDNDKEKYLLLPLRKTA